MREILRKTSELFWERPILWLPTLVAQALAFIAFFILSYLYGWSAEHSENVSVLNGSSLFSERTWHTLAIVCGGMKRGVPLLLSLVLGLIAITVTAKAAISGNQPRYRSLPVRIFQTSAIIVAIYVLLLLASIYIVVFLSSRSSFFWSEFLHSPWMPIPFYFALNALCLKPVIRFLRPNLGDVQSESLTVNTYLLITSASVASYLLGYFLTYVDLPLTRLPFLAFLQYWSSILIKQMVTVLPYIGMSIALGLLFTPGIDGTSEDRSVDMIS